MDDALLPLAELVADGAEIDWEAEEARFDGDERRIKTIREMRVLFELRVLHRSLPADASSTPRVDGRPDPSLAIGQWAHLVLVERLGGGTFGEVYRAWDRHLECDVALKLLREDEESDDLQTSRIAREGRLLARVRHSNVVTVHGVAVHERRVGLWMELVRGTTLEQLLLTRGTFSAREASLIGIELCRALAAIHGVGLVHRDIKAQNVMREAGGRIVLMDFGTGREMAAGRAHALMDLAGTPLYLAPEIFHGASASAQTDLYSLGVLLYHLVTDSYPARATSMDALQEDHATGKLVRLRDARADLPTGFVSVVDRAIANDPARRYASVGALESALVRALDDRVGPPISASPGTDHGGVIANHGGVIGKTPESDVTPRHQSVREPRSAVDDQVERQLQIAQERRERIRRWIVRVAAGGPIVVLALGLVGFVATVGYNTTYGRVGTFARFGVEPWAAYLSWGVLATFPTAVVMTLAGLTFVTARFVLGMLELIGPIGRVSDALRKRWRKFALAAGLDNPAVLAQAFAGLALFMLIALFWYHAHLIRAATSFFNNSPIEQLLPLRPTNSERGHYRAEFDVVTLALALALFRVIQLRRRQDVRDGQGTVLMLAGVLAVMVLLSELTYRTLTSHPSERVDLNGARCYITGQTSDEFLVLCPGNDPPRNRAIRKDDPSVHKTGITEEVLEGVNPARSGP
jgi:serine/threonine protein kinase